MQNHLVTISLCMIVKDEEETLSRCLNSVEGIADEIIIVDTGSTDRTKEIARQYTDHIFDFIWVDDFAAARNYAFDQATMEYILWLDADDVLLPPDQGKFKMLKANFDHLVDVINMPYNLAFNEYGNPIFSLRRNRLVRQSCHFQWRGAVHEYLAISGNVLNSDIAVTHSAINHDSDRNLHIYEQRLARGEKFTPRDLYYYANELFDHQEHAQAAAIYEKFLATGEGWLEDCISACNKLADCFHILGDKEQEKRFIYQSFDYDVPRADFCCRLGFEFLHQNKLNQALFWYKLASELEKPVDNWGPVNHACWTWLPHLQLCVCYDRLGQHELAHKHNEIAASYIPDDPKVLQNRLYLQGVINRKEALSNQERLDNALKEF